MRLSDLIQVILGIMLALLLTVAAYAWIKMQGPTLGGDFSLMHKGQYWNFKSNGKPLTLLYFGYAKCPDVCPMALSNAAKAFRQLTPQELEKVRLIFISVDSDHETTEEVANYATQFFPEFIGLSGGKSDIRKVADLFGASYMEEKSPNSYLGYSVSHTDKIFFIDSYGIVKDFIPNPRSSEDIYKKIKGIL